jgi:hypothetical protein
MATRSRTSFNKRQKELARLEKQRDKAAKRAQRKIEKQNAGPANFDDMIAAPGEYGIGPDEEEETKEPE